MSFEWILNELGQNFLRHNTLQGENIDVPDHAAADYIAGLHASEKQQPIPAKPTMADITQDPDIQAAALEKPDALTAAIRDAMAQAGATREAAAVHAMSASTSSALAQESATSAQDALAECHITLAQCQEKLDKIEKALATIPFPV